MAHFTTLHGCSGAFDVNGFMQQFRQKHNLILCPPTTTSHSFSCSLLLTCTGVLWHRGVLREYPCSWLQRHLLLRPQGASVIEILTGLTFQITTKYNLDIGTCTIVLSIHFHIVYLAKQAPQNGKNVTLIESLHVARGHVTCIHDQNFNDLTGYTKYSS